MEGVHFNLCFFVNIAFTKFKKIAFSIIKKNINIVEKKLMYNSYERYVTTTCADEYGVSAHIDQTTGSMCTCSTGVRVWEKREPSIWRYNHMPPCKYLFYFYFLNITLFQFNIFFTFQTNNWFTACI